MFDVTDGIEEISGSQQQEEQEQPQQTEAEDKQKQQQDDPAARAKELEAELKRARREAKDEKRKREQAENATREWYDRATKGSTAEKKPAEPVRLNVDLAEAIAANDGEKLKAAIRELGYVSREELTELVTSTKAQMAHEAKLYRQFPDLENTNSELYKRTVEIYQEFATDPHIKQSPRAIEWAAKQAQAELKANGGRRRAVETDDDDPDGITPDPKRRYDDDDEEDSTERRRQERVRAQQGGTGRAKSRDGEGSSKELTAMQKSIVARFRAAGADITEESYRARADKGVQMSGLPTRGGR